MEFYAALIMDLTVHNETATYFPSWRTLEQSFHECAAPLRHALLSSGRMFSSAYPWAFLHPVKLFQLPSLNAP
jgi:hypothetical protein